MRIEQLGYLVAVTQHGSLRGAAEKLHVSQPALSEALSQLERELGVSLLDRRRTGSRISRQGRDLLPDMVAVLDAVAHLRMSAGDQQAASRTLRVGTVATGTSPLLLPAVRELRAGHPNTSVEIVNARQVEIEQELREGSLDLGLVNVFEGDDIHPDLRGAELMNGRPVVCCRTDDPLAATESVTVEELRRQPFVAMRSGYLMHRFAHRLFAGDLPAHSYATDGAELGKVMVAEGLGVTVLPDFSIAGDPLVRAGVLTLRPIAEDDTAVTLLMLHRRAGHLAAPVRALQAGLVRRAAALAATTR